MTVRPLDTLLAIKMLGLVPGLNGNDRRVATVLLEHFNRQTGQCDPGLDRIAQLLGISTRTVIRCNHKLEHAGLFQKVRHGGHGNRNSYEPVWSRFAQHEAAWRVRFNEGARSRSTKLSLARRQTRHLRQDKPVTQTCNINLNHETCSNRRPRKQDGQIPALTPGRFPKRIVKSSADAARDQAERRWLSQLDEQFRSKPITYGEVIGAITPEMQAAATDAEFSRRGAGIAYIVKQLNLQGHG